MKKSVPLILSLGLVLTSCGTEREVTLRDIKPLVEQTWTIAQTGISESNTGTNEQVSTWSIEISGSGNLSSDNSLKPFSLDDYFEKGMYSIIKKESKWEYTIYTIDPSTATWKIDEKWNFSCGPDCVNFITKDKKLIYTNLDPHAQYQYLKENEVIGWLYRMYDNWAIFSILSGVDWFPEDDEFTFVESYVFTYIDFWSTGKMYEDYTETTTCTMNSDKKCREETKKTIITKEFYKDPNHEEKLSLKATNLKDAYFEYYKDEKSAEIQNNSWSVEKSETWAQAAGNPWSGVNKVPTIQNGSITVVWEYYFDVYLGQVCFHDPDNESSKLIPRKADDARTPWFCFVDQKNAKKSFWISDDVIKTQVTRNADETCTVQWKAQIRISDYVVNRAQSGVSDTARLVEIFKQDPFERECSTN